MIFSVNPHYVVDRGFFTPISIFSAVRGLVVLFSGHVPPALVNSPACSVDPTRAAKPPWSDGFRVTLLRWEGDLISGCTKAQTAYSRPIRFWPFFDPLAAFYSLLAVPGFALLRAFYRPTAYSVP